MNGHLSAGGGFQGGVVAASLFVCRYLIHDIYDIPTNRVITFEKLIFAGITLLAVLFIFAGLKDYFPMYRNIYLVAMNLLIGLKVACGFFTVFYRFIAFERR
jgi:multicomponent Na+:H+ antiporter subunit B